MFGNRKHSVRLTGLLLAGALLAGCNNTPYPNGSPISGARLSANPAPPASVEFCRIYARQTAGNAYENQVDRSESFGAQFAQRRSALRDGGRAYRRCLAGRTN